MKRWLWLLLLGCLVVPVFADDLQWERIGPVAGTVRRILPDRGHPGTFYLLMMANYSSYYYYGLDLFRSTDNGQSWTRISMPNLVNVMVHSASSELFVVRRGRGSNMYDLLSSKDQGRTFQLKCGHAPQQIFDHPTNPNILWGGGLSYSDYNLSVSYDGGAHWKLFTNLPYKFGKEYEVDGYKYPVDYYDLQSILVSPLDGKTVYVSTDVEFYVGCGGESITLELVSTNDGKTWASAEAALQSYIYDPGVPGRAFSMSYDGLRYLTPSGWKRMAAPASIVNIVSVPGRPDLLYALNGAKQWVSRDGGSHWSRTEMGPGGDATVLAARTSPVNTFLAGTSGGGLYVIDENRASRQVTAGLSQASVRRVATAPGSSAVYAVTQDDDTFFFRSLNGGKTWLNITDLLARPIQDVVVDPKNGRHVFALVNNGIRVSFDAGQNWQDVPEKALAHVFFDPRSTVEYFSKPGHNKLFRSADGGRTLQEMPAGFGGDKNTILDLEVDPFNSDLYAATSQGLFVSRDGGQSAVQIGTNINPDCPSCWEYAQILALPQRGQYLAVAPRGIYKSLNQGVTWRHLSDRSGTIVVADTKGQHLYMLNNSYYSGLYESFDGGVSWNELSAIAWEMTDPLSRPLFLATRRGLYRAKE